MGNINNVYHAKAICGICGTNAENNANGLCINNHDHWIEKTDMDDIIRYAKSNSVSVESVMEIITGTTMVVYDTTITTTNTIVPAVPTSNTLRVIHGLPLARVPLVIPVQSESEAKLVLSVLSDQYQWLVDSKLLLDQYSSPSVEMLDSGEWVNYYNNSVNMYWEEYSANHIS